MRDCVDNLEALEGRPFFLAFVGCEDEDSEKNKQFGERR